MKRKLSPAQVPLGSLVTCYEPQEAYYSGRYGNPITVFKPGMVGRVASVMVPYVCQKHKNDPPRGHYFVCVDFCIEGRMDSEGMSCEVYRVALSYYNVCVCDPFPKALLPINPAGAIVHLMRAEVEALPTQHNYSLDRILYGE